MKSILVDEPLIRGIVQSGRKPRFWEEKMKIEIFERRSGNTIETLECDDMKAFRIYWNQQSNRAEYGFRMPDEAASPFQQRVIKEADGHHSTDDVVEFLPFDDATCAKISEFNSYLTPGQVHHALMQGKTIYTNFRRYRLEQCSQYSQTPDKCQFKEVS